MTYFQPAVVASLFLASSLLGCGKSDLEIRREQSIADYTTAGPIGYSDAQQLLGNLKASTLQSLASPTLCQSRIIWNDSARTKVALSTYWIERRSTPDALRITWDDETIDCVIPAFGLAENETAASVGVVFGFAWWFPEDNERVFELLLAGKIPSVTLLKNGKIVSNTVKAQLVPFTIMKDDSQDQDSSTN